MASKSIELGELFHLTLLRHLGTRLSGRSYSVKGGICLRFFHRSPRLSEDMDLDIVSSVRVETLRKAVDSIVKGNALSASLLPAGIERISCASPKQTDTTQRWKVDLTLKGGASLPTKVEFSRRKRDLDYRNGIPDAELLRRYKMPPFAARYYGADSMAAQKIIALASPKRHALRDLFDLHHLLCVIKANRDEAAKQAGSGDIERAAEKTSAFTFQEFKKDVVPYLTAELIDLYEDPTVFDQQRKDVEEALIGMMP